MNTEGRVEKALRVLAQSLRSLESVTSYFLPMPRLAWVPVEAAGTRRKRNRFKTGLLATTLALAGVGNVWADGVVSVVGATGGAAISADTAGGSWTTLSGPAITNLQSGALAGSGTLVLTAPAG